MGRHAPMAREDVPPPAMPVQLTVTVEARHGKEVPVLKQGDVMVFQKKERLPVTGFAQASTRRSNSSF